MKKPTKADLNWDQLKFDYLDTKCHFVAHYRNGKWEEGHFTDDSNVTVHQGSTCLHYSQQCFEGMKAYESPQGNILMFRPKMNWERMQRTAKRLMIACPSQEFFINALEETLRRNYAFLPPHHSVASLYIRPLLIGCGENLGLNSAKECQFRIFVSPVGGYFGDKCGVLVVCDEDRVAPRGLGKYKAGSNYAAGFALSQKAREQGGSEALYLDSEEHKYLDEAGSANVIVLFKDGTLASPLSSMILPSITRKSVMELAEKEYGIRTEMRKIAVKELANAEEVGLTGTAATVVSIGTVRHGDKIYSFYDEGKSCGPCMTKIYEGLTGIQRGTNSDTFQWTREIQM